MPTRVIRKPSKRRGRRAWTCRCIRIVREGPGSPVSRISPAPLAAAVLGVASLVLLDGDIRLRAADSPGATAPAAVSRAVQAASQDLSRRASVLAEKPEVGRSLAGGGIAVNRLVLFSAARQAMEGASSGTWIA